MMPVEQTGVRRVIGVDPGPTPGVVVLDASGAGLQRIEAIQCTPTALLAVLEAFRTPDVIVAVERFVARGRASHEQRFTADQVAFLRELWPDVVLRSASEVKPWATEARLAKARLLEPTKGMRHARDAGRHALYAAVHDGGLPDPLSKRWQR